ncbi:prephenate dehydratase [Demequina sp. NBRC 110056]|uniref:prephenate dehydratase n=1 Tax=Demequina sp. NBRC 110056 TaxID=1570345 RepID=UPI000A04FD7D|nr:prephenate dehydratase [Demequina sp. NBRC 110056]
MTDRPRYAFLGPAGTFTEAALYAMVGDADVEAVPVVDVPAALGAVRSGEADYAVVAIENTVEGGVTATLDTLAEGAPLVILGETVLPVEFELVAQPGVAHGDIQRITAHSHAWAQVRRWAHVTIPQAVFVPASSNASGALAIAAGEPLDGVAVDAALAPPGTAERLGLTLVEAHVADNPHAATRFVRIGRPGDVPAPTGRDKTTLTVHLPTDRSGALLEMLEQFAARGVNLSRIESRPRWDRPGEYSFSIDALGHIAEERIADALAGLRRTCPLVVFLGSYPAVGSGATAIPAGMTDAAFDEARDWVAGLRNGQA